MQYEPIRKLVTRVKQCNPVSLERDEFTYIDISAIDRELKLITNAQSLMVQDAPSRARQLVTGGDVLVSTVRPNLNTVASVPKHLDGAIASTGFCILRADPKKVDDKYLFYLVQTPLFIEYVTNLSVGAGYPAVTDDNILDFETLIPTDVSEQRRVASILEAADDERRRRRAAQAFSDTFLQNVFVQMFGDPVENPNSFPVESLGNFVEHFDSGVNFNPISNGEPAADWRVLKISAVTMGIFDGLESKPISRNTVFDETIIVRKGDLLMSRANTTELVGAVCIVRENPPKVLLPDKLWRVRLSPTSKIYPDYLLFVLRQPSIRRIIGVLATGTSGSMKNISKEKAGLIKIPIAPTRLQEAFAEIVGLYEQLRRQQQESARQADHLFQTLLHRAFNGEL